jgi:hypothetical protein
MPHKLKVYSLTQYVSRRDWSMFVAASSWKEAAKIFKTTLYDMRTFGLLNPNDRDIEIAMREPGRIFASDSARGPESEWTYRRVNENVTEVGDEIIR